MPSKILAVDDNRDMILLLGTLLEKEGYQVTTASSGQEALEKVKKQLPDLILLDVIMPEIDGLQICKILKEDKKTQHVPVIMLSVKADRMDKVAGLDTGADDYITKPFHDAELLARIRSHLRVKDLNDALQTLNEKLAEKQKALEEELEQGRRIQMSMLPHENPNIQGYDITGLCIPAAEVGGDYYDFIPLADNRLSVAIGDVAGKGIPAALLMAMAKSCLYTQVATDPNVFSVLNALNRVIQEMRGLNPILFMTFLYSTLDRNRHILEFSNAGHCFPYYYASQNKELYFLSTASIPLGIFKTPHFEKREISLFPGDILVYYSDGIIEAKNRQNEIYSFERLENSIKSHKELSAAEMCGRILMDVDNHMQMPQSDDITLVVIKRL
jgi:sigma-B regulation protein RsbU (phosphoserine phosphatase)